MKNILLNEKKVAFAFLCLACITISFNVAALAAVLPVMRAEFSLNDILVSRIISFYMIPYGVCALLFAPLTRRISYKYLMAAGMITYGLMSFYCAFAETINQLLLGRVVMGLSGACAIPLGLIIIGKLFSYQMRGRLVGALFSCSFIASIAGLLTSGVANWRWLFLIPGLTGIATGSGILLVRVGVLKERHNTKISYMDALMQPDIQRVFIFILCISALYHGVHNWMGIYIKKTYNLPQIYISLIFVLKALTGASGQMVGGLLADKRSRYAACLLGIVLLSASTLLLAAKYAIGLFVVVLCLMTAGWTIGHNGISTLLTDFPEEFRPQIASLNSAVRFIAGGIGFYLSGFLVAKGFNQAFFIIGILMVISSIFLKSVVANIGFGKKHI